MMQLRDSVVHRVTIAAGASASTSVKVGQYAHFQLEMPAALTGTAYAVQVSPDNVTFLPLVDQGGTAVTITHANSSVAGLDADVAANAAAAPWIRFVSNGTEAATRTLRLYAKS